MKYETNVWYGWNGGECPVHPDSQIHAVEVGGVEWVADARYCHWPSFRGAFRVTKPYVEPKKPREWWIVGGCEAWNSKQEALENSRIVRGDIIHVREVIE